MDEETNEYWLIEELEELLKRKEEDDE